jgi:hypothetical protein
LCAQAACQWITESLGGSFSGDYTSAVTHLIAGSELTEDTPKAKAARAMNRPVR